MLELARATSRADVAEGRSGSTELRPSRFSVASPIQRRFRDRRELGRQGSEGRVQSWRPVREGARNQLADRGRVRQLGVRVAAGRPTRDPLTREINCPRLYSALEGSAPMPSLATIRSRRPLCRRTRASFPQPEALADFERSRIAGASMLVGEAAPQRQLHAWMVRFHHRSVETLPAAPFSASSERRSRSPETPIRTRVSSASPAARPRTRRGSGFDRGPGHPCRRIVDHLRTDLTNGVRFWRVRAD